MDAGIRQAVDQWLRESAIAEADKQEIRELQSAGNERELTERFYRELEFGTGGMRGTIGAGLNRMNVYTVGAAVQGLAAYIAQQGDAARRAGVAIAHDNRRLSDVFARRCAEVLAGNGIKAYLFEELRPTPELSFAVRHLGCTAGIVITASHNPPQYNGFKVYWAGGVQVVPPHDKAIIAQVRSVGGFGNIRAMELEPARRQGLVQMIGAEVDRAFLDEVRQACFSPEVSREQGRHLKIVYTPLHGTGGTLIPQALKERGFERILCVPEQSRPDPEFSTVASPNPEEGAALDMGIALARKEGADLVIATDPDADRVGAAVRVEGDTFALITGNQMAALLTYYICESLTQAGRFPSNGALITTIVSGDMMKDIARGYGAAVFEVLTGFKWIGAMVDKFVADAAAGRPSKTYLFGAEESYGYMPAAFVRDKDAATSTAFIADLAALAASRGQSLYTLLQSLYARYGYYQEGVKNITLPGKEGADKIREMMGKLRQDCPRILGGIVVNSLADMLTGDCRDVHTGELIGRYELPASDVLLFHLRDGTKVIARPSGTEPKIKFYILTKSPAGDLAAARTEADRKIQAIMADLAQRAE